MSFSSFGGPERTFFVFWNLLSCRTEGQKAVSFLAAKGRGKIAGRRRRWSGTFRNQQNHGFHNTGVATLWNGSSHQAEPEQERSSSGTPPVKYNCKCTSAHRAFLQLYVKCRLDSF